MSALTETKMKTMAIALLALIACGSLAACSSHSETVKRTVTTTSVEQQPAPPPVVEQRTTTTTTQQAD